MLIKNISSNRKTRAPSLPKSSFFKDSFSSKILPNQIMQQYSTACTNTPSHTILRTKTKQSFVSLLNSPKRKIQFIENHITLIMQGECERDQDTIKAIQKLRATANVFFDKLPITKKDIMVEKEVGLSKMMEVITMNTKENEPTSNIQQNIPIKPKITKVPVSRCTKFSSKWKEEMDSLTENQKSLVYSQVCNDTRSMDTNKYDRIEKTITKETPAPQLRKQSSFLNANAVTTTNKSDVNKRIVHHLISTYDKIKNRRLKIQ